MYEIEFNRNLIISGFGVFVLPGLEAYIFFFFILLNASAFFFDQFCVSFSRSRESTERASRLATSGVGLTFFGKCEFISKVV